MKIALIKIANTWAAIVGSVSSAATTLLGVDSHCTHFPTIVAQTTEGQIMDGPRGLQLITQCGPIPVDQTPNGFMVHQPVTHLLQPTRG